MNKRKHSSSEHRISAYQGTISQLWDSFWNPPVEKCPKCNSTNVEYYDPFFFNPIRTLKKKRRIKCYSCKFIWRPQRKTRSFWERFL